MNNNDPFENQLRAQPPHLPSAQWREEILAAALAATAQPRPSSGWRDFAAAATEWLWPRPLAYAGLLAVWAVILALRLDTPASDRSMTGELAAGKTDASGQAAIIYLASLQSRDALLTQITNMEEVRP